MKKLLLIFSLFSGLSAFAGDWYVATNGAGQGTSWADATNDLQGAITACASNYTVWVSNGTYYTTNTEMWVYNFYVGGGVTVRSISNNPANVIIDGKFESAIFSLQPSSRLIGLTVQRSYAQESEGGGICNGTASNCIIINNLTSGALYNGAVGNGVFYNCLIQSNQQSYGGWTVGKNSSFHNCVIKENDGGDYGSVIDSSLYNCLVTDNVGGEACLTDCDVFNCTLTRNSPKAVWLNTAVPGLHNMCNSISWDNAGPDRYNTRRKTNPQFYPPKYSCGEGYDPAWGTGCFSNNPRLVSGSNLRLQEESPCRDAGSNTGWVGLATSADLDGNPRVSPTGGTVDMGAYEFGCFVDSVHSVSID